MIEYFNNFIINLSTFPTLLLGHNTYSQLQTVFTRANYL